MSEPIEKKLISAIATAWNKEAPSLLGSSSELSLLALREVSGESMTGALAVAGTWSSAFATTCEGISGVLIFLFKSEDDTELEQILGQKTDGSQKPGCRNLVSMVLSDTSVSLSETAPIAFGTITYIDLASDESRLAKIVGDSAYIGTFSLTVGDNIATQALTLYAPSGSLSSQTSEATASKSTSNPTTNTSASASVSRRATGRRGEESQPKNIERLLDVELDIIVRFGVTHISLRDLVRIGVGTMIELKRTVDDPVELLVNGRQLARGEVVVVDGYYGVRITEIGTPAERANSIL
jgi:flagellar motor switch protein FliN